MTTPPASLRDRLLAGPTQPVAEFPVPGTDAAVYLRRLSFAEARRWMDRAAVKGDDRRDRLLELAAPLVGDAQNRRLFGDEPAELEALAAALPWEAVVGVVEAGTNALLPAKGGPAAPKA